MSPLGKTIVSLYIVAAMVGAGLIAFTWDNSKVKDRIFDEAYFSRFSSNEELTKFFQKAGAGQNYNDFLLEARGDTTKNEASSPAFSTTNVQVEGVDELDTVKNDGRYVYVAGLGGISIIDAYPPENLANISFIPTDSLISETPNSTNAWVDGIFVLPSRLVAVCSWYEGYRYLPTLDTYAYVSPDYGPQTVVSVLDIEDPSTPELVYSVGISGSPLTARLTGGVVYLISQSSAWVVENETAVPVVTVNGIENELPLEAIRYDPDMDDPSAFTNILALDVSALAENVISIVTGYSSTIYASAQSIYLTTLKWHYQFEVADAGVRTSSAESMTTTIYKIAYKGLSMGATAKGSVKGMLLNQFSMDERSPYLRVTTTSGWTDPTNAVYVLDDDLDVIGALEGIATGERIYSSRFVGETLYLVTFRQIDPLFVIDLSAPSHPLKVGELTLPGFSTYLHPVDKDHLLGIGSEDGAAKVSLFDVSDKGNPMEVSKWVLPGHQYSSTIWDHKEVLYDSERGMLVLPVTTYPANYDDYNYSPSVSGAYVFDISADTGISLRGVVEMNDITYNGWSTRRSLYIGDFLYTVWGTSLKVSLISDLTEIGSLQFYSGSGGVYRLMA
jgi:inhibitor of cysteine peptidase